MTKPKESEPVTAYDPELVKKLEELTSNPDLYYLQKDLDDQITNLDYLQRQIRSLNTEANRTYKTIELLRSSLAIYKKKKAGEYVALVEEVPEIKE